MAYEGGGFNIGQRNTNLQNEIYRRDFERGINQDARGYDAVDRERRNHSRSASPNSMEWVSTYDREDKGSNEYGKYEQEQNYGREYNKEQDFHKDERNTRVKDAYWDSRRDEDVYNRSKVGERERYRDKNRDLDREREREIERELERARHSSRRDREWDRDKDRSGRKSSRDRSGERSRWEDRDRERGRDRGRDRDRRRDDRSERDYGDRKERRRDSYEKDFDVQGPKGTPSAHIMVRGLSSILTQEDELAVELQRQGLEYQDVKIVRNRHGESRGFGFVDFYDVPTAEKWMNLTKGTLIIKDHKFLLEYSKTQLPPPSRQQDVDWYCSKCRTLNYASRKRTTCFSCGEYRKDHAHEGRDDYEEGDSKDSKENPISAPPCNVLMMRGLDTNSTEETIRNNLAELTSVPIFDVRLIKDKVTGLSRGFCFIEVGSTEDATVLMKKIQESDPAYFIDGKRVSVGYAKNTPYPPAGKAKAGADTRSRTGQQASQSTANANIASVAIAQAQAAQLQGQASDYGLQQQQQYEQQYVQGAPASQQPTDTRKEQNLQASQSSQGAQQQPASTQSLQQQQPQAIQGYTYDATTGYYYDATTGLYYDANTGYYYNGNTGKFLHWDAKQSQYLIVNQDGTMSSMDSEGNAIPNANAVNATEKVKAKPTGSNAKRIAKDMERWAKKTNQSKLAKTNAVKQAQMLQKEMEAKEEAIRKQIQDEMLSALSAQTLLQEAKKASSKSMFSAEEEENTQSLAALLALKTGADKKALASSLVAEYGDDSDDESFNEQKFVDANKMACLLCKRQFPNKDILIKHTQVSDLHKKNLVLFKQKKLSI